MHSQYHSRHTSVKINAQISVTLSYSAKKKKNSTQDQIGSTHTQQKKKINTRSDRINSYSAKIKSTQDQIALTHTQKKKKKNNNSQIYIKKKKIRSDLI